MADAVRQMFGRIAGRYDLVNRVLSAHRDVRWRDIALAMLPDGDGDALDLACGTFDLALAAIAQGKAARVHGCDFCAPMLVAGAGKRRGMAVTAAVGDAMRLPYADGSFDLALVAYGWRNFDDPAASARELARVLRPGGRLLILEFFRPRRLWPRLFYATFGRAVFPAVGRVLAGDAAAYHYLRESVRRFLDVSAADATLAQAGFAERRWRSFFGGVSNAVAAIRA
ncbi:MAG TPA: ubiquinone/menaquinone biosynthesis methyltransferase [Planctomycetota bacterium]|nr:ubiquinone/menaquinone biosynthesis methyltransferase [Planctomycetota bacterium]